MSSSPLTSPRRAPTATRNVITESDAHGDHHFPLAGQHAAQLLVVPWVFILLVTRRSRDVLRWWLARGACGGLLGPAPPHRPRSSDPGCARRRAAAGCLDAWCPPRGGRSSLAGIELAYRNRGSAHSGTANIPGLLPSAPRLPPPGIYTARSANWAARGRPVSRSRGVCITDRPDDPPTGSCRGSWERPWRLTMESSASAGRVGSAVLDRRRRGR